jgi:hypothetical protein
MAHACSKWWKWLALEHASPGGALPEDRLVGKHLPDAARSSDARSGRPPISRTTLSVHRVDVAAAAEETMMNIRSASTTITLPLFVVLALALSPAAHAQQKSAPTPSAAEGNKAAKPPVDAAAAESGVATKKPAKPGAQSGPAAPEADAATAAKGNKAGAPPVAEAASRSGVATKKPAKSGTQSGPAPASAP